MMTKHDNEQDDEQDNEQENKEVGEVKVGAWDVRLEPQVCFFPMPFLLY